MTSSHDDYSPFAIVASAITTRRMLVAGDSTATFTDGRTIFVRKDAQRDEARDAVAIQAALLAAGSLSRDVALRLSRHRKVVADRYLYLEVTRLAMARENHLPPATVRRINRECARPITSSRGQSLSRALNTAHVPQPPIWMGTVKAWRLIRARELDAADRRDNPTVIGADQRNAETDDEQTSIKRTKKDPLPSPLASLASDLAKNFRSSGRTARTDGSAGSQLDLAHRRAGLVTRKLKRQKPVRAVASLFTPAPAIGAKYPEWDENKNRYKPNWCAVAEYDPDPIPSSAFRVGTTSLSRPLARVGLEYRRHCRQRDGDGLDIGGLVDYVTSRRLGDRPDPRIYEHTLATSRDMSILVLLDASSSTNENNDGNLVFEKERLLADQLTASLVKLGDQVATFGFYSRGKDFVRFLRIKAFTDPYGNAAQSRLQAVQPSGFTRLGAVLRHGAHLLATQALARNMVLIVIGDGLPYDYGYEDSYARTDTRRAIQEAVWSGVGVVGLAIRSSTQPVVHEDIWSEVPFRVVADTEDARAHLRPLLVDALSMTRTNGRRRELPAGGEHIAAAHLLGPHLRSNSYV